MKNIYIKVAESGEIVGFSTSSAELPSIQPDFIKVPENHPDIDFMDIYTHYVDSDGNIVAYSTELQIAKQVRPSYKHKWDIALGWVDTTTLAELKTSKNLEINTERERRSELPIEYDGAEFDADAIAQRNIQAWTTNINAGINPPEGFVWRDYNNVDHTADASFILGLNATVIARGTQLYQTSWAKKAEVNALTTTEAVKNYDVTTGW